MLTKCKANMTSFQNNQVYIESERNRFNYNRHPNNFQPGATAKAKFT